MPLKDIKDLICGLEFKPPVSVDICGSFTSGLALRSTTMVDVRLIIPKVCTIWICLLYNTRVLVLFTKI